MLVGLILLFVGCSDTTENAEGDSPAKKCDLSIKDSKQLYNTEWLAFRDEGDTKYIDVETRMRFYEKDGGLALKYNAGSSYEMYNYYCSYKKSKNILKCEQPPKVSEVCKTLLASDKKCTEAEISNFYEDFSSAEMESGIEKAMKFYKERIKRRGFEAAFKKRYNRLENKLMGEMEIKVDKKTCSLTVADAYKTMVNGKMRDNFNNIGTNPFVPNEKGELLWEHCNVFRLFDMPNDEYPKDWRQTVTTMQHPKNKPVNYLFLEREYIKPEEGCTYGFDVWLNGTPLQKGLKPEVVKVEKSKKVVVDELRWKFAHTFTKASTKPQVTTWVIEKKCGDNPKKKIVTCNQVEITN